MATRMNKKLLTLGGLALTTALSTFSISAHADNPWGNLSGDGFSTNQLDTKNTVIDTHQMVAVGRGSNLDILSDESVRVNTMTNNGVFVASRVADNLLPTMIDGKLSSNGKIVIQDTNGILYGSNSRIDVNGLVSTTAGTVNVSADGKSIELDDFANDGRIIVQNGAAISIKDGGLAAFVAPTVVNQGVISAKMAKVELAGSNTKTTVDLYGDGLLEIAVDEDNEAALLSRNDGDILNDGGVIHMTTGAAKDIVNSTVNMQGIARADSVTQVGGKIILGGAHTGRVRVAGKVQARGQTGGGEIDIKAKDVIMTTNAIVNARNFDEGDGGSIKINASNNATIAGQLKVQGGNTSGNAGTIETSAANELFINRDLFIDATANNGDAGSWTIDPINFTVNAGVAGVFNTTLDTGVNINASATNDVMVNSALAWTGGGELTLNAGNDLLLNSTISGNGDFTGTAGRNIVLAGTSSTSLSDANLSLTSGSDVFVNNGALIDVTNGNIEFTANNANGGNSAIEMDGDIQSDNGDITMNATNYFIEMNPTGSVTQTSGIFTANSNKGFDIDAGAVLNLGSADVVINAPDVRLGADLNTTGTVSGTATKVAVENDTAQIQDGIDVAATGANLSVGNGTYNENIHIDRDITINGESKAGVIVTPASNTATSGDARAWWLVNDGVDLDLANITFDGAGYDVYQAIRHKGEGSIDNVAFKNISYNASGPHYQGVAVAAFGTGPVDITNSTFDNIGRVGTLYFGTALSGSIFADNVYTGKGAGDWLDYALDISAGAQVDVLRNTITNNYGVASSDGSTSAAVLVSTYFGTGTSANLENNFINNNTSAVAVGFDGADTSVVTAHDNDFSGNDNAVNSSSLLTTADFSGNWWGSTDDAAIAASMVGAGSTNVDFTPYLDSGIDTDGATNGFQGDSSKLHVTTQGAQIGATGRIQEAVNKIEDGVFVGNARTVQIHDGTYNENVVINKSVTVDGNSSNATNVKIQGTGSGNGLTLAADDIDLRYLTVDGFANGIYTDAAINNIFMRNVNSYNNANYGFEIHNNADVNGLDMRNVRLSNNKVGMRVRGAAENVSIAGGVMSGNKQGLISVTANGEDKAFNNVTITNTKFVSNLDKGIYLEKLSNANIRGIEVRNSGTNAASNNNAGIDVNLKYGDFENITFDNVNVNGSGLNGGTGTGNAFTVKARDDGSTYGANPASLTNLVLKNSTILASGTYAVALGNNVTDVTVDNNIITGAAGLLTYGGVDGVTISGNTFNTVGTTGTEYGVALSDTNGADVIDNKFNGAGTGAGVVTVDSDNVQIGNSDQRVWVQTGPRFWNGYFETVNRGNDFADYGTAVAVNGGSDNKIVQNTASSVDYGVQLNGTAGALVKDNVFDGNSITGIDVAAGSDNAVITDNTLNHFDTGIQIANSDDVEVNNNTMTDVTNGIDADVANGLLVINNDLTGRGNLGTGISVENSDNVTIGRAALALPPFQGNDISNFRNGIAAKNVTDLSVQLNSITGINKGTGIALVNSDDAQIGDELSLFGFPISLGNTVSNFVTGISLRKSNDVTITNNELANNKNGIQNKKSDRTMISDNTLTNTKNAAIRIFNKSDDVQVLDNEINGADYGVLASDAIGLNVAGNQITDVYTGVDSTRGDNAKFTGNTIENAEIGVFLEEGLNTLVDGNDITNFTDAGVVLERTVNANVTDNFIQSTLDDTIGLDIIDAAGTQIDTDNRINDVDTGVKLSGDTDTTIDGNDFRRNGVAIASDFDPVYTTMGLTVTDNTIRDGGMAMVLANTPDAMIGGADDANIIINNGGVLLSNSDGVIVDNNILTTIDGAGISVINSDGAFVTNNQITGASGNGIFALSGVNNVINGNTIITPGQNGVNVQNTVNATIANNIISGATNGAGVLVDGSVGTAVVENTISDGDVGVGVRGYASSSIIEENEGESQILMSVPFNTESDDTLILGNTITNNEVGVQTIGNGVNLVQALSNELDANAIGFLLQGGEIDISNLLAPNAITGGETSMIFDGPDVSLVNNSLGATIFTDQTGNYVTLQNGALFNPGTPTIIDGLAANYNGVVPLNSPLGAGLITGAQRTAIEALIQDFNDDATLGDIIVGLGFDVDEEDLFALGLFSFSPAATNVNVTFRGLPPVSAPSLNALANISPAAGGNDLGAGSAAEFASLEPASGGNDGCWAAVGETGFDGTVNFSFGGGIDNAISDSACAQ